MQLYFAQAYGKLQAGDRPEPGLDAEQVCSACTLAESCHHQQAARAYRQARGPCFVPQPALQVLQDTHSGDSSAFACMCTSGALHALVIGQLTAQ